MILHELLQVRIGLKLQGSTMQNLIETVAYFVQPRRPRSVNSNHVSIAAFRKTPQTESFCNDAKDDSNSNQQSGMFDALASLDLDAATSPTTTTAATTAEQSLVHSKAEQRRTTKLDRQQRKHSARQSACVFVVSLADAVLVHSYFVPPLGTFHRTSSASFKIRPIDGCGFVAAGVTFVHHPSCQEPTATS
jgi:hypothetical protein